MPKKDTGFKNDVAVGLYGSKKSVSWQVTSLQ
jgi:hypothetical protein